MPPPDALLAVFAASLLLALTPGPDNLFVLTQAAVHGRAAGLLVTLGLCTGLFAHTAAVALGVAALLAASPVAFTVLKTVGAAYLLWLAWGAFRAGASTVAGDGSRALRPGQLYRRGIVMNVTNPKVSLFFLAFLPQFADPEHGPVAPQLVVFGGAFLVATLLVFGGVAVAAGMLGDWLRQRPGAQRALNRLAGLVFVALAARLVLVEA